MHNLANVMRFEVVRTLKKPSFWLNILSVPVLFGIIAMIVYFSSTSSEKAQDAARNEKFSFVVKDDSGLVTPTLVETVGGSLTTDASQAASQVRTGKLDAFFHYPSDIEHQPIRIYHQNNGLLENSRYDTVAKMLLTTSVEQSVSPQTSAILSNAIATNSTVYQEGEEINIIANMIPPAFFLILFYTVIVLLGTQMLTTTTEEKENRVTEMLLTSLSSRTLIIGKILSLGLLGILQIAVIALVPFCLYFFGRDALSIPDVSAILADVQLDPVQISISAGLLATGLALFTGLLVAIGAATPTAKEANSFFGFVILIMMVPFYFISLLMTKTDSIVVDGLTYFPLTAPFTSLIRNAFDTIEPWQGLLSLGIVTVSALIALALAIRIFRYGTLEYSNRLSFKAIFKKG